MKKAHVFVFLDEVQISNKTDWVSRTNINCGGRIARFGAPVSRPGSGIPIRESLIDDSQPWRRKALKTLQQNYGDRPYFEWALSVLRPLIQFDTDSISEFNINAISVIAELLEIECRICRQSDLAVQGASTDLLVGLVKASGCDCYLSGDGAAGYQEDEKFKQAGLELRFNRFEPFEYGDPSRFIPGLSIIDYLFEVGPKGNAF